MSHVINISQFMEKMGSVPVVDVRTPAEYLKGHIPDAINIPLFTNEERAEVGTLYKQQGRDQAVLRGLELVGPKLAHFVRESKQVAHNNELIVHCWRGGMRSSSFAWLLQTAGITAFVLEGGYKAYRHFIRERFADPAKV